MPEENPDTVRRDARAREVVEELFRLEIKGCEVGAVGETRSGKQSPHFPVTGCGDCFASDVGVRSVLSELPVLRCQDTSI